MYKRQAIEDAITVYNENRAVMREFVKTAADYPQVVDPVAVSYTHLIC